ncbi:MAG: translation elongation factor Ts [Anaerococcus vaginalis]|uniref:translation elongation factor Ts n=1 Tax=Anaerococcus vaginalis TaxID=33037 RepID=UPI002911FA60|nr:translation elongation factor Ts [Anaerococcus vaginalis]MDU4447063.1 translation elongation factor Ts [Anaerococcus vaginalis]MDU6181536.1 translation elongation factor Ts [Anaerococcus vaginalis]MDU7432141.1 translation elongation factor Ts [Anaerococcus vaginalis]
MMAVSAKLVKELREKTGAGMMDCKKALTETDGNIDDAIKLLKEKGQATLDKKADRIAAEGIIGSYIHNDKIGVIVEINTETDFSANTDTVKEFAKNIAMHIAALNPLYISEEDADEKDVAEQKEILIKQAMNESNPNMPEDKKEMIAHKKVEGRLKKYFKDVCLMDQQYIKNPDLTIEQYLRDTANNVGENIKIRRFARFEVGEGLEKKEEDFAKEVQSQMNA